MPYTVKDIKCYMPRNTVLFLDADNRIIAYLELVLVVSISDLAIKDLA